MTLQASASVDLAEEYAEKIKPLIEDARRAYGSARPDSPQRRASDQYNTFLLEYKNKNGNIHKLAEHLGVADATLRRRLRVAKSGVKLGRGGLIARGRGRRDPELVKPAAEKISAARASGDQGQYRAAVAEAYGANISLYALADELGMSYFALYTVLRSAE